MLIDTHAHLTTNRFRGEVDAVLARAAQADVGHVISIACDLADSEETLALAADRASVSATVGIHPCYVHEIAAPDWPRRMESLASSHPVAAIGEIGLDYYHKPPEGFTESAWRLQQREVFELQLDLASRLNLPVVVHQRESGDDVLAVLRSFPGVTAVLHCFTGTVQQAETALAMGHFLSFTGVVTYPKADDVRRVVASVPQGRFMVETDSPYLAPVPFRGKTCEPAQVVHTARKIAEVRGQDPEELASETSETARSFFRGIPATTAAG